MKRIAVFLGGLIGALIALGIVLYIFGPYEPADLDASFDAAQLDGGVAAYFEAQETQYDDITPGVEKRVVWHGAPGTPTDWVVVYLHGFSATSEEIRPIPDRVAEGLEANLIFTRLKGHGRSGAALAEARVSDWMADVAEALAAARAVGERILVMSVSTGGTLATAAALDPALSEDVKGLILVSPNFGINNPAAPLLTLPAARQWVPLLAGAERSWEPHNRAQGIYWTTRYPSAAGIPVAALVQEVTSRDLSQIALPALFMFSDEDKVVLPEATRDVAEHWGGPVTVVNPDLGPGDDPSRHVIAGDILSPGQNDFAVKTMLEWAGKL